MSSPHVLYNVAIKATLNATPNSTMLHSKYLKVFFDLPMITSRYSEKETRPSNGAAILNASPV